MNKTTNRLLAFYIACWDNCKIYIKALRDKYYAEINKLKNTTRAWSLVNHWYYGRSHFSGTIVLASHIVKDIFCFYEIGEICSITAGNTIRFTDDLNLHLIEVSNNPDSAVFKCTLFVQCCSTRWFTYSFW